MTSIFKKLFAVTKCTASKLLHLVTPTLVLCLLASYLPVAAVEPPREEPDEPKQQTAATSLYLPIIGNGWKTEPPKIGFVQTTNDGGNYCIWSLDEDPGVIAAEMQDDCLPIPIGYVDGVVALKTSLGSAHFTTTGSDDKNKAWESDIKAFTTTVPMLDVLNLGSLQQDGPDSGKVSISAGLVVPPNRDLEEIILQQRQAAMLRNTSIIPGYPVHQMQVMYLTPGIPGDPIFLVDHCTNKRGRFYWGEVTPGFITNWATDSIGFIYAQMNFSECPSASGKWVPVSALWALALSQGDVTNEELDQRFPPPVKRTAYAYVTLPTGEQILTALVVTVVVIGVIALIVIAAPELVALSAYASGWLMMGYTLSTATGPHSNAPPEDVKPDVVVRDPSGP